MAERPILFSAPMVRAILEGRKTVTRRAVKGHALRWLGPGMFTPGYVALAENGLCPFGHVGDRLYVRETHFDARDLNERQVLYAATGDVSRMGWTPSIHMPKQIARIWLEVTAVRVERLCDITEQGARREGLEWNDECLSPIQARDGFADLWDGLAKIGTHWADNPWVWVVEFRRIEGGGHAHQG